jgi:hypothetical protein
MNLTLSRKELRDVGIFSILTDESGNIIAHCLEHSYDSKPKLVDGEYTCQRGDHLLHGMTEPFSTFEVIDVPNCKGILFHWGNYNRDSEGCVLVGERQEDSMVTNSRKTFEKLMELLEGLDQFNLTVL